VAYWSGREVESLSGLHYSFSLSPNHSLFPTLEEPATRGERKRGTERGIMAVSSIGASKLLIKAGGIGSQPADLRRLSLSPVQISVRTRGNAPARRSGFSFVPSVPNLFMIYPLYHCRICVYNLTACFEVSSNLDASIFI
jgi:hypothetical protein